MKSITVPIDKTNELNIDEFNKISKAFREWRGKGEVVFRSPTRTPAQNKSLNLYCAWLATALSDINEMYCEIYFGKTFEKEWTQDLVKEKIFKPILKSLCGKTSTTKATTTDICDVADYLEKNLSAKLGIDLGWPDKKRMLENSSREL